MEEAGDVVFRLDTDGLILFASKRAAPGASSADGGLSSTATGISSRPALALM